MDARAPLYPKVIFGEPLTDEEKKRQGFVRVKANVWYNSITEIYAIDFVDDPPHLKEEAEG